MQFLNNDRVTFHLTANVLLFKWEAFSHIFPSRLFSSLANSKQCSYIRMEHGNYHLLSWVGALACSYLPSVAGEWWLVAGGTLGWLAHRRQGRLLLQRENNSGDFHISISIFDTTKHHYTIVFFGFLMVNKWSCDWGHGFTMNMTEGQWSSDYQVSRGKLSNFTQLVWKLLFI